MTWAEFLEASPADKLSSGKLEPIADYLKIDMGDDDTALINCVSAAVQYIIASVGVFPDGDAAAELLLAALTQNFYESRELMQMDIQQKKRIEYTFGSILLQLQMQYDTTGGDED